MWIKDHHERIVNSDNVVHFSITDANKDEKGKKDVSPSWVVAARILKTDWNIGSIVYMTEGFDDKKEAVMRLDAITEGLRHLKNFLELE